jgi:hypothetical protein
VTRARLACALAAAFTLAGCPRRDAPPTSPPPPQSAGPSGALADGGMHHTERLAQAGWRSDGAFQACGDFPWARDQPGKPLRPGPCLVVARAGELPIAVPAPQPGYAADASPPERAPGGCRVRFDDAPGDPGAPAARATLVGTTARAALDAWKAPREVSGDYFAVETSFSPDGKWLAIVHSAVGIGEEGRLVGVIDAEVRAAPPCK